MIKCQDCHWWNYSSESKFKGGRCLRLGCSGSVIFWHVDDAGRITTMLSNERAITDENFGCIFGEPAEEKTTSLVDDIFNHEKWESLERRVGRIEEAIIYSSNIYSSKKIIERYGKMSNAKEYFKEGQTVRIKSDVLLEPAWIMNPGKLVKIKNHFAYVNIRELDIEVRVDLRRYELEVVDEKRSTK